VGQVSQNGRTARPCLPMTRDASAFPSAPRTPLFVEVKFGFPQVLASVRLLSARVSVRKHRFRPRVPMHRRDYSTYLGKISGPFLDRIDLHSEAPALPYQELRGKDNCASSAEIRERVVRARAVQQERGSYNAYIPVRQLRKLCALDEAGERILEVAVRRLGLSARAHDRILKVARTCRRPRLGGARRCQAPCRSGAESKS
jgi:hypothetical protein